MYCESNNKEETHAEEKKKYSKLFQEKELEKSEENKP